MTIPSRTLSAVGVDWSIRAAGHASTDRPVAVWSHRGITTANAPARAAGVRPGMRRRSAQGRCPELELIASDPLRDARAFEPVVAALSTLTPWVEIVEPGVATFGTRGPSRYFGGDDALAEQVLCLLGDTLGDPGGIRVGVADGPLVARLAAGLTPPGLARVLPVGGTADFLAPLPIGALAPLVPDTGVLGTFVRLGLSTLGEVAALPETAVTGRFGPDGIRVHRIARGDDPSLLAPTPVPDDVESVIDLDPPELRADAVAFAARTAAETFATRLADRGLSCAQVVVTLTTDHAEESCRRWRLDGPANPGGTPRTRAALIAERVRWQTDGWLSGPVEARPSAGVTRVVLAPGVVAPARGRQLGFWGGISAADERAARAVARLEALFGPDAVCVAESRGGRHPGSEVTLVPTATADLTVLSRRGGGGVQAPWPGRLPTPAPILVWDDPRPVEVLDVDHHSVEVTGRGEISRPPATIHFSPRAGGRTSSGESPGTEIIAWAGPWPVDERWWDPITHQRQARLQILTGDGAAYLVTRQDRRWWLSASYS